MSKTNLKELSHIRTLRNKVKTQEELFELQQKDMEENGVTIEQSNNTLNGNRDLVLIVLQEIKTDGNGYKYFEFNDGLKVYL